MTAAPAWGDERDREHQRLDQLDANLAAATLALSGDELAALDAASAIAAEYPGWMLELQGGYRDNVLKQPPRGG